MQAQPQPWDAAARNIALKIYRLAHQPRVDLVPIALSEVAWRDRRFLQRTKRILEGLGFRDISCFRMDVGAGQAADGLRYRLLTTQDGAIRATVAVVRAKLKVSLLQRLHLVLIGKIPQPRQILEFTTTLSSGGVIDTSNSGQRNPFTPPAHFDTVRMPENTPPDAQLAAHRRRVESRLAREPGISVVNVTDFATYDRVRDAERETRNRYRQSIGYVTDEELRALTKEHYAQVRDGVMAELTRLQREDDKK
jgi:hypothetical protein